MSPHAADPSQAPASAGDPTAPVYVLTATGVVDNVMAGYIEEAVQRAADDALAGLIVMLNTPGGSLDSTQRIVSALLEAPLPTIVWVAPSGGRAASAGTFITLAANLAYMAPGTNIGAASPVGAGGEDLDGHDRREGQERRDGQHPLDRRGARPERRLGGLDRREGRSSSARRRSRSVRSTASHLARGRPRQADGQIVDVDASR